MKKLIVIFSSFVALIFIIAIILWFNMPSFVSSYLTREFGVETSVSNVKLNSQNLNIFDLNMSNPKGSKSSTAFQCKKINFNSTFKNIRSKTLTINSISLNDIVIGVEFYNRMGSDNNWSRIMQTKGKITESKRKYLIKTLSLNNIAIVLVKADGTRQNLPTIDKLEFHNITDESGFPIDEIEKAIAHIILRSIFQKYNLLELLKSISPVKIFNQSIPFPFLK
ncbi:MAG: hypothetical protein K1060chlam5_00196 [Candidatus Anoxychlamydiales bacterium]|nr:hypothetical protein [Candidatus Anoxychlamydiales bacterium]